MKGLMNRRLVGVALCVAMIGVLGCETEEPSLDIGSNDVVLDVGDLGPADGSDAAGPDAAGPDAGPILPPLSLTAAAAPISVPAGTLFYADLAYGPHARNVVDIFVPDSVEPTALIVYIHGGGFNGGNKDAIFGASGALAINRALDAGVAFATWNYRLLADNDPDGVTKPLGDSMRALQFLRAHAKSLNLDPARVSLYGTSAGAGTALWLGTHDEMADPDSDDPIARMSTRVMAVGAIETQSTYDLVRWETEIFKSYGITLAVAASAGFAGRIYSFYGIDSLEGLETPDIIAMRADVDMLALIDDEDAALWIRSVHEEETLPITAGVFFHHPYHARAVAEAAETAGLFYKAHIPKLSIMDETDPSFIGFALREMGVTQ